MSEIVLVRFIAICLVTSYHLSFLISQEEGALLDYLGNVGNFLFFLVSGYTLRTCRNAPFGMWIARRYCKIFLSVWVFYFLCWTLGVYEHYSLGEIILLNKYWFLNAIIFFYPVYYICIRFFSHYMVLCYAVVLLMYVGAFGAQAHDKYIMQTGDYLIQWYPYFFAMLLGASCSREDDVSPRKVVLYLLGFVLSVDFHRRVLDYAMDFSSMRWLQLSSPLLCCISSIFAFKIAQLFSVCLAGRSLQVLSFISIRSLEIYIVQFVVIAFSLGWNLEGKVFIATFLILVAAIFLQGIRVCLFFVIEALLTRSTRIFNVVLRK